MLIINCVSQKTIHIRTLAQLVIAGLQELEVLRSIPTERDCFLGQQTRATVPGPCWSLAWAGSVRYPPVYDQQFERHI